MGVKDGCAHGGLFSYNIQEDRVHNKHTKNTENCLKSGIAIFLFCFRNVMKLNTSYMAIVRPKNKAAVGK